MPGSYYSFNFFCRERQKILDATLFCESFYHENIENIGLCCLGIKSLPFGKNVNLGKLKAFADDILNVA